MNCAANDPVYVDVSAAGYTPGVGVQQQSSHTQAQAVLGTYSPMASHQCSMVQVNTEHLKVSSFFYFYFFYQKRFTRCLRSLKLKPYFLSPLQGGVQMSYPQGKVATTVGGEAAYCCVVPPPSHHGGCHPSSCTNLAAAWSAQYWRRLSERREHTHG